MVVIVDYGMGNLRSIQKKLERIKIPATITSDPNIVSQASKIILPGVGHFGQGMTNLQKLNLIPILNQKVIRDKIPTLGICLGLQLLSQHSQEGDVDGLGYIDGSVVKFDFSRLSTPLSIPHVGYNNLTIHRQSPLLANIPPDTYFYFTHSYHLQTTNNSSVVATTSYGYDFPSIVQQDNIFATQFHPEKSHLIGLTIYKNFINQQP